MQECNWPMIPAKIAVHIPHSMNSIYVDASQDCYAYSCRYTDRAIVARFGFMPDWVIFVNDSASAPRVVLTVGLSLCVCNIHLGSKQHDRKIRTQRKK